MTGRLSLFIAEGDVIAGFAGLDVVDFPRKRVGRIAWIAGEDMDLWGDAIIEAVEVHARLLKCSMMMTGGRKGWEREALRYGYTPSVMGLVKPL